MARFLKLPKKGYAGKYLILVLRSTANNLFFTVATRRGNVILWGSCGTFGFRGPRRATPLASEQSGRQLAERLASLNFRWVDVEIHSLLNSRLRAALKGLFHSKILRPVALRLRPSLAHNGSRPAKLRRV